MNTQDFTTETLVGYEQITTNGRTKPPELVEAYDAMEFAWQLYSDAVDLNDDELMRLRGQAALEAEKRYDRLYAEWDTEKGKLILRRQKECLDNHKPEWVSHTTGSGDEAELTWYCQHDGCGLVWPDIGEEPL